MNCSKLTYQLLLSSNHLSLCEKVSKELTDPSIFQKAKNLHFKTCYLFLKSQLLSQICKPINHEQPEFDFSYKVGPLSYEKEITTNVPLSGQIQYKIYAFSENLDSAGEVDSTP